MGFELIRDEYKEIYGGRRAYRIRATEDIYRSDGEGFYKIVNKGDKGGFVESKDNLNTIFGAWIGDDSVACGDARIEMGAILMHNAYVKDTHVTGWSVVDGLCVKGDGKIDGRCYLNEDTVHPLIGNKIFRISDGQDVEMFLDTDHYKTNNPDGAVLNYFHVISDDDMTEEMVNDHLEWYEPEGDDDNTHEQEKEYWDKYLDNKIGQFGSYGYFEDCVHAWRSFAL